MKNPTVYAFIDSQNLHKGTSDHGWKLDYHKFMNYLKTKYNVNKVYMCIGFIPTLIKLYSYLQECGFILIFKPVLEIKEKGKIKYKGNVDAELVLHTMININKFDKAIIVSGDGDFYCLVEYLSSKDKLGKIITPNNRYSSLIKKYAPYILSLDNIWKKLQVDRK